MSISIFTTWATGVLNGYQYKDGGLPNLYKYGTMGLSTGMLIAKSLGSTPTPIVHTGSLVTGLFVGIPLMVGSTFCLGHFMGKSLEYSQHKEKGDAQDSAKN